MTHFPILTSLVALPIAGALVLLFVPNDEHNDRTTRAVALVVSLLVFAETLLLWYHFNAASAEFQFTERYAWIPAFGISYFVGVDGISLLLVVLTGFLTPIALLGSWESVHKRTNAFAIFVLLLEAAMIGVFVSLDLFLFYVFWDAMLIPMYFLIGIWGYDRRVYAAIKFLLYTMAGSVLMLLAILGLAYMHSTATGSYSFDLLQLYGISQMPVSEAADGESIESVVGSVTEKGLLDRTYRDPTVVQRTVGEVMDKPLPLIDAPESLDSAFTLLSGGAPAVVVVERGRAAGVVTKLDLLEFLAHGRTD